MIDAVPTKRPVRVSQVWSGWVSKRLRAMTRASAPGTVSRRRSRSRSRRSGPGGADTLPLAKRHGGVGDDGVAFREPALDLDLGEPDEPHRDVAALGAAAGDEVDEAAALLAAEGGAGDGQH